MTLEFWLTSTVVTATPGTGVLFTVAAGLAQGVRAGVVAALGCTLAIVPHLALALSGAAAVLAASPLLFEVVRWLGIAYLLVMARGSWRQTGTLAPDPDAGGFSTGRTVGSAVLVNLLNPKLTLFFLVFLPMFVRPGSDDALLDMTALALAFTGVSLVVFVAYGAGAGWVRRHLVGRPAIMRRISRLFAVTFVALATMLALSGP